MLFDGETPQAQATIRAFFRPVIVARVIGFQVAKSHDAPPAKGQQGQKGHR